jgi:hypothetical protein
MGTLITDNATFITMAGLIFTLSMGVFMIVLPRRFALMPVFALICFMTMGERLMIAGLNFTMIRILLLFGWTRLIIWREIRILKFNRIDLAMLCWQVSRVVLHNVLWQNGKEFQNTLGGAYDELGMYFLFRFLIRDPEDIKRAVKTFALFIVPVGLFMLNEKLTGRNAFSTFGGVPDFTTVREGARRCQGPFLHPILAGTFGAVTMPLFISFSRERGSMRLIAALGAVSSITIVVTSASSGPVLACLCGILGLGMWSFRQHLRTIRWAIALTLFALHLVMKSPVWFLMAKMDIFSGSTGFHRALLIDQALHNLGQWWFCGTKETASWGQHLEDVTNQYINEGIYGGLLTLVLYIRIVVLCFAGIGSAVRKLTKKSRYTAFCVWSLGAALFAHAITFLSVSYFDQNAVNFSLLLAMISGAVSSVAVVSGQAQNIAPQTMVPAETPSVVPVLSSVNL